MPSAQEVKVVGEIGREFGKGKAYSYLFDSGIIRLEEAKLPVIMATAPIKDNSQGFGDRTPALTLGEEKAEG